MKENKIIGWVGAVYFENYLQQINDSQLANEPLNIETALFRLDQLTAGQIAAIVKEILSRPTLEQYIALKIPRALIGEEILPDEVLIDDNAASVRNQSIDKQILITASSKNDIGDTLAHITIVSAKELKAKSDAWVQACCKFGNLTLTLDDEKTFAKALEAMTDAIELSLVQIANFCLKVIEANNVHGLAIRQAIGWALPSIGLPRDTYFFSNSKAFSHAHRPWKTAFDKLASHRYPLLKYQKANGQPLDPAEMESRLNDNLEEFDEEVISVLQKFIKGSIDDVEAIRSLAELEWEQDKVYLIFDRPKEKQNGLADSTLQFFSEICDPDDALTEVWSNHLNELKTREKRSEWIDEDKEFFDLHRYYLEQDAKLLARWEKIIFGQAIECNDFLEGLVSSTYQLLAGLEDFNGERYLKVSVNKGRKAWLNQLNHDAVSFFCVMYRGLYKAMGSRVTWEIANQKTPLADILFDYENFLTTQKDRLGKKFKSVKSLSRAALQIKFEVSLIERQSGDQEVILKKNQLIWNYSPNSIGLALADDLGRLLEKDGIACTQVSRKIVSKKGGVQSVSLDNVGSLEATFSNDPGSLIPSVSKLKSQRHQIKQSIEDLFNRGFINEIGYKEIKQSWEKFERVYPNALQDFKKSGLNQQSIFDQANAYAELLDTLLTYACNDVCRNELVAKVLSIGTVVVSGEQSTLIIPPWHPERLKSLAVKTKRTCALLNHLLTAQTIRFGDRNIFFKEFFDELKHPFYPEVAILQKKNIVEAELVSVTSTVNGYSLLESPLHSGQVLSDTSPQTAAKQINELIERYIGLQPHKLRNLNILLYNSDAADLPLAVVKELSNLYDTEQAEMKCNVMVRHTEPRHLASIYAELVNKAAENEDLPLVSEISDNFISKLRIGVSKSAVGDINSQFGSKPFDIAFLHDVVARTATIEWIPAPWSDDRESLDHAPSRWSYRRVAKDGELKSTNFLTCPWQTATGWSYLAAVAALAKKDTISKNDRFLPARQITLQDPHLAEIMEDAHQQAEWVATYDELLDKKQLQNQNITVVRYRRNSTNGRNMIVSSTADLRLLNSLTYRRLEDLTLDFSQVELQDLSKKIKNDALSISGLIVLRAARRGISAGEMLGLVLSRYLISNEFNILNTGYDAFNVFFLLDDYASWLSQKENRIADLLALSVVDCGDQIHLHIAIVESKYVSYEGVAEARRSSKAQLMATLTSFKDALFGDPSRLDRDVWLSRISDLLVDADVGIGQTDLLERARIAIREGTINISLRGYSHVFVHSTDVIINGSLSEQLEIDSSSNYQAWQEVFDKTELRALVEAYAKQEEAIHVRSLLGTAEPWKNINLNRPALQVNWTSEVDELQDFEQKELSLNNFDKTDVLEDSNQIQIEFSDISSEDDSSLSGLKLGPNLIIDELANVGPIDESVSSLNELILSYNSSKDQNDASREEWADKITRDLKRALNGWGFQVNVLETRLTPNGCLVRLAGSDRLRVEDIEAKRTQLLTTHAINIVTVQPKPGEIVVTISSDKRQAVSIWDLWQRRILNPNKAGINVSFVIGVQELNGELLYLNLGGDFSGLPGHEPHSLVAGATGSGKSVLLQVLLLDIAATNSKDLAQIILIDPKMGVDYTALEELPHMREPIIKTKERATEVLANLVDEMENRYQLFAQAKARDLATYNSKIALNDRLPMVFLVHDEFADWMFDDNYKSAVSAAVQRLGVKARAAGIHLIFAAQRPDKDVMPMQLRENLGNRLILKVASEATSKIALDRSGAERLLGKGHLAAKLNSDLIFAQVPFVSDEEIDQIVAAIVNDNDVIEDGSIFENKETTCG